MTIRLQVEKHLLLDVRTMTGLANHLKSLNVSRNSLSSLSPLRHLRHLEELDASGNKLTSAEAIENALAGCTVTLRTLDLLDNPFLRSRNAVVRLVAALPRLATLNGSEVSSMEKLSSL